MKSKYYFWVVLSFTMIIIHSACSKTANNLDGNWFYEYSDTAEYIGRFEFSSTLTIKGELYMLYEERVSEFTRHWESCQIGKIKMLKNEIQLYPEAFGGEWIPWRKADTQDIKKHRYILNGKELVLMKDDETVVYTKSSELDQNQLLIYSGTMSGAQTLNIKLVIGALDGYEKIYYMYIRNGNYDDPLRLRQEHSENGTLLLNEIDEDYEIAASMEFYDFNPNANTITGVWQDLRPGLSANKYDVRLSK